MKIFNDISTLLLPFGNRALEMIQLAFNIASLENNNNMILQACGQQSKIIFALKSYTHTDRHDHPLTVDLTQEIDEVLNLYEHKMSKRITIIKKYDKIPHITCRAQEINQVWTNLIFNAIQAIPEKGTIQIHVSQNDDSAIVKIIDSGVGISEDIKDKIFTPFFTTKSRGEGSGLGLGISKKIIESHGGKIEFTSKPGETIFTVYLPLKSKIIEDKTQEVPDEKSMPIN